jgi:hypothetical protein
MFFLEKKNQKTFIRLTHCHGVSEESVFASFSSEKEAPSFLPAPPLQIRL